jgi:hypothetical protein
MKRLGNWILDKLAISMVTGKFFSIYVILQLIFLGVIIFVGVHFIKKYW